jgi:hypothetical protein
LLAQVYDQCRRAVFFLRWNEGDADAIAPSLYTKRPRRAASLAPEVQQPEPEPANGVATPIEPAQPSVLDGSASHAFV